MDGCNGMTSKSGMLCIEKPLELPLAFCLHLIRFKYNDHFRLGALFVTSPKSQIILFTIANQTFWQLLGDFILHHTKNVNKQNIF